MTPVRFPSQRNGLYVNLNPSQYGRNTPLMPFQPFNAAYIWYNTTENEQIYNTTISYQNTYSGGSTQQATSVVTTTDQNCYQENEMCYSVYGYEVRHTHISILPRSV